MKTIAFYSYKGGVGRSLALVNVANRLAEFGKKVCILDFDLEAPGLDSKYGVTKEVKRGLVDYIYNYAVDGKLDDNIADYKINVRAKEVGQDIHLIPAGNVATADYWKKLSRICWWDLFYKPDSQGIEFFFYLKKQIEDTLAPDYLLIDNRTGITELSSLTLSLLAERVVVLAANNKENMEGSKRIIDSLTREEDEEGEQRQIHFVLTRVPNPQKPDDVPQSEAIIKQKYDQVKAVADKNGRSLASCNVIHAYRELEEDESHGFYKGYNASENKLDAEYFKINELDAEYFKIYDSLTKGDFSEEEERLFVEKKEYQKDYLVLYRLYNSNKALEFFKHSDELLEKYADNIDQCNEVRELRCFMYYKNNQYKETIIEGELVLETNKNDLLIVIVSIAYSRTGQYKEAYDISHQLKYDNLTILDSKLNYITYESAYLEHTPDNVTEWLQKLDVLIAENPQESNPYCSKACLLRELKKYPEALVCVYKALELDPKSPYANATLAEIKYLQGDKEEFYRNIDISLSNGFQTADVVYDLSYPIYLEVSEEERFQALLRKYKQTFKKRPE